jgi:CRP-like cAMP-binding protein
VEGSAFAEMSDDEGRCMRVETFAPVQALASAVLFAPHPILPVTVGAQSECRVIAIRKIELLKLCMSDTTILEALLSENGSRIQFLSERLRLTQFATLRQRISDWLLRKIQLTARISPNQDLRVKAEPTFEKIADLMGVARPSLSRELSRMKKEGLLEIKGKTIEIKNLDALKEIRHSKIRLL